MTDDELQDYFARIQQALNFKMSEPEIEIWSSRIRRYRHEDMKSALNDYYSNPRPAGETRLAGLLRCVNSILSGRKRKDKPTNNGDFGAAKSETLCLNQIAYWVTLDPSRECARYAEDKARHEYKLWSLYRTQQGKQSPSFEELRDEILAGGTTA